MASVFALFVMGLALCQIQVDAAARNSEQIACFQNPDAVDLLSNF